MPLRVDDPELMAKVTALKYAGYVHSDQEDLRLRWLELEIDGINSRLKRLCDVLEAHVLKLKGDLS